MAQRTIALRVDGMSCAHCACRVEQALQEQPGVTSVSVDLDRGHVNVQVSEDGASAEELAAAIKAVGYDATAAS